MSETTTRQTRLNQVFMLGAQDRYLSFTLSGIALDDQANGPDDAFEVALLNLQANGTELAATGLTHVTHPDDSRTYLVDLSGMATANSGATRRYCLGATSA